MVVAVGNQKKAKYSIHSLFDADKFDYTERTNKDGSINTRPDWLRIYSYSRFSKTTIETGQIQQKLLGMCTFRTKVVNIRNLNFGEEELD
jgi:hypothetical protein